MSPSAQILSQNARILSHFAMLRHGYGMPYEIDCGEIQQPAEGEAVVRLNFTGVCHGDVYSRDGGGPASAQPIRPLIGGHEGIGEIVALGIMSEKPYRKFNIGDKVGVAWRSGTCGKCQACKVGAENHCQLQEVVGMHRAGTFQQYIIFPIDGLIRLPNNIDAASACPILCAGVTSYVAIRKMKPQMGKWCAISGAAGGVGHLAIQYARNVFGLKVLAIDGGSRKKEEFCREMGCDDYVDFVTSGDNFIREVQGKTSGGPEYILILSPHQSAYDAAGQYAGFRAQIVAVGIGNCSFPLRPILKKDLLVRSSETGTKQDVEEALQLAADGIVSSKIEMLDLFDLNVALDRLKAGVLGKLVLDLRHPGKATSLGACNLLPAISESLPDADQGILRRYEPSL